MNLHRRVLALAACAATAGALLGGTTSAEAATSTLCNFQTARVSGGTYVVQNNEWGSSASECITTDGMAVMAGEVDSEPVPAGPVEQCDASLHAGWEA